ncbi:hypothetical protein VD0002_g3731 [Verticillium dahliae]|uniref:Uncharacterized protein n=1 Tax=Verticillium dahliae (strain VdLs.17 / ATCC MYA-4575 / FGSC 10137) TaxID=498257 RepID=G2X0R0_VERDV|nr:uncharacterized protein VDAG_03839 [Verticillium dahliae VdLs.17]EGY22401.1 hypothetical protein VDAG_03839 [Verticillium dahliae VdLs.17]KAF3343898.1 Beta-xylosidase [Verticillium dahliae VDG2]KAH6704809.1 hypothetical protein EV126DRAFT_492393 [Verticillium dahliae]PNH65189.1 hypothetical protein VD0002_g3731 [Verticillium dahliae]
MRLWAPWLPLVPLLFCAGGHAYADIGLSERLRSKECLCLTEVIIVTYVGTPEFVASCIQSGYSGTITMPGGPGYPDVPYPPPASAPPPAAAPWPGPGSGTYTSLSFVTSARGLSLDIQSSATAALAANGTLSTTLHIVGPTPGLSDRPCDGPASVSRSGSDSGNDTSLTNCPSSGACTVHENDTTSISNTGSAKVSITLTIFTTLRTVTTSVVMTTNEDCTSSATLATLETITPVGPNIPNVSTTFDSATGSVTSNGVDDLESANNGPVLTISETVASFDGSSTATTKVLTRTTGSFYDHINHDDYRERSADATI